MKNKYLSLFDAVGVEIEYAIVDKNSLDPKSIADEILFLLGNNFTGEVEFGDTTWSNELANHNLELKLTQPAENIWDYESSMQNQINKINLVLDKKFTAALMPTSCHPWLNPADKNIKLWAHENSEIYQAYNKLFNCKKHGWVNLQSVHLNLPFANDVEFARLHNSIRFILPIIPALTASSPILDNRITGIIDSRLETYRTNQTKIPTIAGSIIPEQVFSKAEYEEKILQPMYRDISKFDTQKILTHEWLNSRGAIARFDRNSIEIRIMDTQECVGADLAIVHTITDLLKAIIFDEFISHEQVINFSEEELFEIFLNTIKNGSNAVITNSKYLTCFGIQKEKCSAKYLWGFIFEGLLKNNYLNNKKTISVLHTIISSGNLSERILAVMNNHSLSIKEIYLMLVNCLNKNIQLE